MRHIVVLSLMVALFGMSTMASHAQDATDSTRLLAEIAAQGQVTVDFPSLHKRVSELSLTELSAQGIITVDASHREDTADVASMSFRKLAAAIPG